MIRLLLIVTFMCVGISSTQANRYSVRLKDVGKIIESRENQLLGYGLVVGLRHTGDSKNVLFTNKALTNLLKTMGISSESREYTSRNVASVIVTTDLASYTKKGQRIDVVVSSLGDSTSLSGGTLLRTELKGSDQKTYAIAQGPLLVGGISGRGNQIEVVRNQTTVGRIPNGAIVEVEIPVSMRDNKHITMVLNKPNYTAAARVAKALKRAGFLGSFAVDANMIKIPIQEEYYGNMVEVVATIEKVKFQPDTSAKVIINARTGTVAIGEMVRLYPVALTHGSISVKIGGSVNISGASTSKDSNKGVVNIHEKRTKVIYLNPQATLSSLVKALNKVGATPKDLISIIQALKESGSLVAQVVII